MSIIFKEKPIEEYERFVIYEKIVNTKGYIYLLKDSVFPGFIKLGKTVNLPDRLNKYNNDKPFPTASFYYISKVFENKDIAEYKILNYLYSKIIPNTFTKEWFKIEEEEFIKGVLLKAEEELM